jgi:hypothetical protein
MNTHAKIPQGQTKEEVGVLRNSRQKIQYCITAMENG